MAYQPKPIDTSSVRLPDALLKLSETLAKNTHEWWALKRRSQGWVCGARRDEVRKTHPGLVPYEELPEAEKEYDRTTAMETLKAIVALGYEVGRRKSAARRGRATTKEKAR